MTRTSEIHLAGCHEEPGWLLLCGATAVSCTAQYLQAGMAASRFTPLSLLEP